MHYATDHVVMIRPKHFGFNPETAANNTFQQDSGALTAQEISAKAIAEFDGFVRILRDHGVQVDVIEDSDTPVKPDAIFPNNWFSTEADGTLITYPMFSPARRTERRGDVIAGLSAKFRVSRHYSFEVYEEQDRFLEGTGSLVLDRVHRIAYACISERTDMILVEKFCIVRDYTPVTFHAVYGGKPVYHTNVVMALGASCVVICMECIADEQERTRLKEAFERTGKEILGITSEQMAAFAGNMLELQTEEGGLWVMSEQAYKSLRQDQLSRLTRDHKVIFAPMYTIEQYGGGSARCMIAENFLERL